MWNRIKSLFKNTLFNIFLIFLLTGVVFWLTIKDNKDQVFSLFRDANYYWIAVIAGIVIFERVLLGWKLSKEVQTSHPDYKWSQGFVNSYVAGLFNNITPSSSGGQFVQVYVFKKQGIPMHNSIGVLWLDFIIYQTSMILVALSLILLKFRYFYENYSQFFLIVILGFMVNAAVIVGLWALVQWPRFYTWLTTTGIEIGSRLHLVKDKKKTLDSVNDQLTRFSREVIILKTHKKMVVMVALEDIFRLLMHYSIPYFCAKALNIPVQPDQMLNIIALSSFVMMVNAFLPMPGSSGGTEATFVLMFSTIFNRVEATSIMILWRVMTFYLTLFIGSIMFAYTKVMPQVEVKDEALLPEVYTRKQEEKAI